MLIEWFVDFVGGLTVAVFEAVLGLLPGEVALGDFSMAASAMMAFNEIFPVDTALVATGVVLGVTGIMFLVKLVQTVVAHIPFVGGGGA